MLIYQQFVLVDQDLLHILHNNVNMLLIKDQIELYIEDFLIPL